MSLLEMWVLGERLVLAIGSLWTAVMVLQRSIDPKKTFKIISAFGFFMLSLLWFSLAYEVGGSLRQNTTYVLPPFIFIGVGGLAVQLWRERTLQRLARQTVEEQIG